MAIYDKELAKSKIIQTFQTIKNIEFESLSSKNLVLTYPLLEMPPEIRSAAVRRIEKQNEVKQANANDGTAMGRLNYCLNLATKKFEYGKTEQQDWDDYFRFYLDTVTRKKDPKTGSSYYVLKRRRLRKNHPEDQYINLTKSGARNWFQETLVGAIESDPKKHHLVIGAPGSGKSTLLKYLLNTNAIYTRNKKIVISRFEFLKFADSWAHMSPILAEDMLSQYISFIVLRDLLIYHFYERIAPNILIQKTKNGFSEESYSKFFSSFIEDQPKSVRPLFSDFHSLEQCLGENGIDGEKLQSLVGHDARIMLIHRLKIGVKIAVMFDGLDAISMEDYAFDTIRMEILKIVLQAGRASLTNMKLLNGITDSTSFTCIYVMRPNTLWLYERNHAPALQISFDFKHHVGALNDKVVLFNILNRAVNEWIYLTDLDVSNGVIKEENRDSASHRDNKELNVNLLFKSFMAIMIVLSYAVGAAKQTQFVYRLFNGNIRDLNRFIVQVVNWFVIEAQKAKLLEFKDQNQLDKIFKVMTSAEGMGLLKSKSYQLINILLHNEMPWFENEIKRPDKGDYKGAFASLQKKGQSLSNNEEFTGFVDNVFNYHKDNHPVIAKHNCLLEKIRILQVLSTRQETAENLIRLVKEKFFYESDDVIDAVNILLRNQMIEIVIENKILEMRTSEKGKMVLEYLVFNFNYLESVFHQTYFPEVIVGNIRDDRRDVNVDLWTARSIRNVYIFLLYIRHVETTPIRKSSGELIPNTLVPKKFQISSKIEESALKSLRKILRKSAVVLNEKTWPNRKVPESLESFIVYLLEGINSHIRINNLS